MALFTTDLNHPLYSWCLPHVAFYIPTMKSNMLSHNMPKTKENQLRPYSRISFLTMFQKIKSHLWEVVRKIIHHCMSYPVHLNSGIFLMCVREMVAMMDESKKRALGLEAQERPEWKLRIMALTSDTMVKKPLEPQTKRLEDPVVQAVTKTDKFALDGHEVMLSYWLKSGISEEEEEEEEKFDFVDESEDENKEDPAPEEEEEPEWSEEDDSGWSDDEEDSEMSTESTELWKSFLNTSDPYNPLYFSSSTGCEAKTLDARESPPGSCSMTSEVEDPTPTDGEEHCPERKTKEGTKKVHFSEEVTVRHLVAWTFASRAAREGSCWLQLARDRGRFRRRVEQVGEVVSPCLTAEHRGRVWERLLRGF